MDKITKGLEPAPVRTCLIYPFRRLFVLFFVWQKCFRTPQGYGRIFACKAHATTHIGTNLLGRTRKNPNVPFRGHGRIFASKKAGGPQGRVCEANILKRATQSKREISRKGGGMKLCKRSNMEENDAWEKLSL